MLKTLTKSKLIESSIDPTVKRNRIVYTLTAAGKERFNDLVEESGPQSWDDDTFGIRFAFFSRTPSRTRVRVLEGRRRRLEELLARADDPKSKRRADKYTAELQRHGLESVEREVQWLTELIEAEKRDLESSR